MRSCWFGLFRNTVGGTVRDSHNTFADPDANEVITVLWAQGESRAGGPVRRTTV